MKLRKNLCWLLGHRYPVIWLKKDPDIPDAQAGVPDTEDGCVFCGHSSPNKFPVNPSEIDYEETKHKIAPPEYNVKLQEQKKVIKENLKKIVSQETRNITSSYELHSIVGELGIVDFFIPEDEEKELVSLDEISLSDKKKIFQIAKDRGIAEECGLTEDYINEMDEDLENPTDNMVDMVVDEMFIQELLLDIASDIDYFSQPMGDFGFSSPREEDQKAAKEVAKILVKYF